MRLPSLGTCAVVTSAMLLPRASAQRPHPRIWFTAEDVPALRARVRETDPGPFGMSAAEGWKQILKRTDDLLAAGPYSYKVTLPGREGGPGKEWSYTLSDEPPPRHDDYPHYPPWTAMFQERSDSITTRIKHFSFAYVVTQDSRYFEAAREIVLHLCAWPIIWTDPSYGGGRPCLDTGHAATAVSQFYDWCYDALSPEERTRVRTALAEKALQPLDGLIDGLPVYHNYSAVTTTGLGVGAIALLGEDERAQGWLERCIARARRTLDAQGRDGGPMEGPMYGTYLADTLANFVWALHSAGLGAEVLQHPFIRSLPRYCIGMMDPGSRYQPTFGDGGLTRAFAKTNLLLALRGNEDAAWYLQQIDYLKPADVERFIAVKPGAILPTEPTWNPSSCFVDVGYASLRDGHNADSPFLAFKCGPPDLAVGHNHFDHNSFQIAFDGTWLATDPGYRSYFQPRERKYTTASFGHNTIALDVTPEFLADTKCPAVGHGQVRVNKGRIVRHFSSPGFDYVAGSAAETYNTDDRQVLEKFERQVLFVKPNLFITRDVLAAPEAHSFHYMLHTDATGLIEVAGANEARLRRGRDLLEAHIFSPAGLTLTTAIYPGAESRGPYLNAATPVGKAVVITAALVPRVSPPALVNPGFESGMIGWTPRRMPGFTENHVIDDEVAHSGARSARIDGPGGYYYSPRFRVVPGANIEARFWAKVDATGGASSLIYFWRDGKSFARASGPDASGNEWRRYELSATAPDGTEEFCLALQFFGEGRAWYDDADIRVDRSAPKSTPATVEPIADGRDGIVAHVDGRTHIVVMNEQDGRHRVEAAGKSIVYDGAMACVSYDADGRCVGAFVRGSTRLSVDDDEIVSSREPIVAGLTRVGDAIRAAVKRTSEPHAPAVTPQEVGLRWPGVGDGPLVRPWAPSD